MYAILGATGKVGRATIAELRSRGVPVRAVVRDAARAGDLAQAGCELKVAEFHDARALAAALDGAQAVQVICPMSLRADDALGDMRTIVESIATALEAARARAVVAISDYGAEVGCGQRSHPALSRFRGAPARHRQRDDVSPLRGADAELGANPQVCGHERSAAEHASSVDEGVSDGFGKRRRYRRGRPPARRCRGRAAAHRPHRGSAALYRHRRRGRARARSSSARSRPASSHARSGCRSCSAPGSARVTPGSSVELYDAHNAGRIDAERAAGEVRLGRTELGEVFTSLLAPRGVH